MTSIQSRPCPPGTQGACSHSRTDTPDHRLNGLCLCGLSQSYLANSESHGCDNNEKRSKKLKENKPKNPTNKSLKFSLSLEREL